jgi:WD40 repeat protein
MAPALAQYVRQSQEVEQLATATLSHWLGLDPDCTSDVDHQTIEACDPPLRILDYEMLDEIGRGGMGVVYRARNLSLDRVVCVKMILQGRLAEQQQIDRFVGEAKAMAALRHPNIVAVHDVDLSAMQLRMTLDGHQGPKWDSVWVSDDSRLVTAGQDGTLRIWDLFSGEEALRIHAHQAAVWSVDRSSSGNSLVSAGADGDVRFWDASPVP